MPKLYYDLHTHSCLSPCGDNDNTPSNLAGIAAVSELDIVALTDHNTAKNCPAFFKAAEYYGITPVAGMELTTAEDIHIVFLFPKLELALEFSDYVDSRRVKIKNREDIFGEQLIMNENEEIIGKEEFLLSNATTISVDEVIDLSERFGGVCFPAHIDRDANSIISVLGAIPENLAFSAVEFHSSEKIGEYLDKYPIKNKRIIIDSDAHYLQNVKDKENYIELEGDTPEEITNSLFKFLRGQI